MILKNTAYIPILGIIGIFMVSSYVNAVCSNLLLKPTSISEIDHYVVSNTKEGERIIMDAYCDDSIYLLYKNRYPANRVLYMLPWYMDWYEYDTIDDLKRYAPNIVLFDENIDPWEGEYTHYANAFLTELKRYYSRLSDNPNAGWKFYVWKKK